MFHFTIIASAAAGGLVKKILETKKEYEVSPSSSSKSKVQVRAVVAAGLITARGQSYPSHHLPDAEPNPKPVFQTAVAATLLIIWMGEEKKKIYKQMEQKGVIVPTLRPQKCCPSVEPKGLIARERSQTDHTDLIHTSRCLELLSV